MVVELATGVVQPGASFSDPTSTSRITQSSNSSPSVMSWRRQGMEDTKQPPNVVRAKHQDMWSTKQKGERTESCSTTALPSVTMPIVLTLVIAAAMTRDTDTVANSEPSCQGITIAITPRSRAHCRATAWPQIPQNSAKPQTHDARFRKDVHHTCISLPERLTSFGQQATIGTRGRYLAVMRGASPVSVTSMTTEASWSCAVRAAAAQTASRESACFGMRICAQHCAAVIVTHPIAMTKSGATDVDPKR